jgi:hypothetical protein
MLNRAYSIHTEYHLKEINALNDSIYIKQIYIKNRFWDPPPASLLIEENLTDLERKLTEEQNKHMGKHKKQNFRNLSLLQLTAIKTLNNNKNLIRMPTNKNLGPAIMDTERDVNNNTGFPFLWSSQNTQDTHGAKT